MTPDTRGLQFSKGDVRDYLRRKGVVETAELVDEFQVEDVGIEKLLRDGIEDVGVREFSTFKAWYLEHSNPEETKSPSVPEMILVVVAGYWPIILGILAAPFAVVASFTGHAGLTYIAMLLGGMLGAVMLDRALREVASA